MNAEEQYRKNLRNPDERDKKIRRVTREHRHRARKEERELKRRNYIWEKEDA